MVKNLKSDADDIKLIQEAMALQRAGIVPLNDPAKQNNQKTLQLQENAIKTKKMFLDGYDICIKELEKEPEKEKSLDGILLTLEMFKMDEAIKKHISDLEFWKGHQEKPLNLRFYMGYSDDMLLGIYNMAGMFYDQKKHQEAIDLYHFVCLLNQDIGPFWDALGLALEQNNELTAAIEAFEKSTEKLPKKFTPYLGLIRCSEKLNDFSKIIEQLTKAEENPDLHQDSKDALEYIEYVSNKTVAGG